MEDSEIQAKIKIETKLHLIIMKFFKQQEKALKQFLMFFKSHLKVFVLKT